MWPTCSKWGEKKKIRNFLKKKWTEDVGTHHVDTTLESVNHEKDLILSVSSEIMHEYSKLLTFKFLVVVGRAWHARARKL